jgi:hypothetical protein
LVGHNQKRSDKFFPPCNHPDETAKNKPNEGPQNGMENAFSFLEIERAAPITQWIDEVCQT